jgi:ABC-type branched-subunit amino acid transport system permease subunit
LLAVPLVLVVLPWLTSGYVGRIVINACRNLVLALSFDIVGATRYINLGHAAFFGIGAYAFGICIRPACHAAGRGRGPRDSPVCGPDQLSFFRLRGPYIPGYLRPAQVVKSWR